MIYDELCNIDKYNLNNEAVEFIKNLTKEIECKKYIINDDIYANIEEYTTKDTGLFEAHKKYIDIQLLLSGEEIIEYTPLMGLKEKIAYDANKDIAFYNDGEKPIIKLKLVPGFFTVLYPQDAHKPQLFTDSRQSVKKVVVKIKVD